MKKVFLILALAGFTTAFAQINKNEKTETVTTKTTVTDNEGKDVAIKAVTQNQTQVIGLADSDAGQVNQSTVMKPMVVNTDVDYGNQGINYRFEAEELGFNMVNENGDNTQIFAVLRPTSQKGYYLLSQNGDDSFGYFNQAGNFVVENYDDQMNAIITTIYVLKPDNSNIQKNKM